MPVTLWATAQPDVTLTQVLRILLGIFLFYAMAGWIRDRIRLRLFIPVIDGAILVFCLAGIIGVQWATYKFSFIPESLYTRFPSLLSDTIHPNVLAGSLILLLPLIFAVLFFCWSLLKKQERVLFAGTLAVASGVLMLTQSRGAITALVAAILLTLILRWKRAWLFLPLLVAVILLFVSRIGLSTLLSLVASSPGGVIQSAGGRVEIWSRALYMIRDFPLTGIGMGTFGRIADLLYPFFLFQPGQVPHAHNLFLQIAVDLGIPGLIAWLSIYASMTAVSWRVYRFGLLCRDQWASAIGAGLLASQAALLLHGLVDAVTWGMVKPAPLVWWLWGLAAAAGGVFLYGERQAEHAP